jgi:RimJ/RimL family protein N-acetyltransferase
MRSLNPWVAPPRPARVVLEGQWCRLEPFDPDRHGDSLFDASMAPGAEERFRWLFEVPRPRPGFDEWLLRSTASDDPLFMAVVDAATGRAEGRQALMRITPEHGVVEIGHILWGPRMARSRIATEALFLAARHVFDDLGYRRFEWKCNSRNEPSRHAALRFGFQFEGIFRQHMVQKGENRDTAWFAIIDADWPRLRAGYERWLAPDNFEASGQQRLTLADALSQR